MPRQKRKLSVTGIYHVIIRGNQKSKIFLKDIDKKKLLYILMAKKKVSNFSIYAYCIMNNHVHMLLNQHKEDISTIMKRINISYAVYYNKQYEKIGHVFQDRFKSKVVDNEPYLYTVFAYILNNPVKAGIVKNYHDYKWSSAKAYFDKNDNITDVDFILNSMCPDRVKARKMLNSFINRKETDESEIIDINNERQSRAELKSISDIKKFIIQFMLDNNINEQTILNKDNILKRNELIRRLKKKTNLSVRDIADLLAVGRGIVQRVN